MTSISALPPIAPALPNLAPASNRPLAPTGTPDFPAQLKAQVATPPPPAAPAPPPPEAATAMSRRPDIEAMLQQMLASRRISFHVTARTGRASAAASTGSLAVPDCGAPEDMPIDCATPDAPACDAMHATAPCPGRLPDPLAWGAGLCVSGLVGDDVCVPHVSGWNGPPPTNIFIWTPVVAERAPLQWLRERLRRRRKVRPVDGPRDVRPAGEGDGDDE